MEALQIIQPGQTRTRKTRTPSFPIQGGFQPMGMYPNFFTPVLPGETLERHTLKNTIVSAPVKSPLSGAWAETWLFYVKITDIDPDLGEMFIGSLTDSTDFQAAADRPRYFTKQGQIDWAYLASKAVHDAFFVNEGETTVMHPDGVPMIKRINTDAFESMLHVVEAPGSAPVGPFEGEEISDQLYAFMRMRQMGMGITSYEDYLKTYGLKGKAAVVKRGEPELLSYRRYWTLPSNVISPEDGSPVGAWYWRLDEKNEKSKRFSEPGFIIGYQAVRPKLLDANITTSVSASLWGFQDWLPSYTLNDPAAGLKTLDPMTQEWVTRPASATKEVIFDHRDLHAHGEQMRNGGGRFTAPTSSYRNWADDATAPELRGEYVTPADLTALWASETVTGLDYDGIVSLVIKGHVVDNT